jgi:hypothetical protein
VNGRKRRNNILMDVEMIHLNFLQQQIFCFSKALKTKTQKSKELMKCVEDANEAGFVDDVTRRRVAI